jgi:serine/threonine protein kinase
MKKSYSNKYSNKYSDKYSNKYKKYDQKIKRITGGNLCEINCENFYFNKNKNKYGVFENGHLEICFNVNNVLGKGMFSTVFRGEMKNKNTNTIIKIAVKKTNHENNELTTSMFCNELNAICNYKSEYAVQYYGYSYDEMCLYLFIEMIDNFVTLEEYLEEYLNKNIPSHIKLNITAQLIGGLQELHSNNIAHNDIKLTNIMIQSNTILPKIKYIDFGLSCKKPCSNNFIQLPFEELVQIDNDNLINLVISKLFCKNYFDDEI